MSATTQKQKVKAVHTMVCEHNSHAALTIGKPYEILGEVDDNKVIVIDDNGKKNTYYKSRFK